MKAKISNVTVKVMVFLICLGTGLNRKHAA